MDLTSSSVGRHAERVAHTNGVRNDSWRCWYVYLTLKRELLSEFCGLEALLSSSDVKGFPVVSSDGQRALVGFIDRTELRYVLGKFAASLWMSMYSSWPLDRALKVQDVGEETLCLFSNRRADSEGGGLDSGQLLAIEEVQTAFFEPTSSENGLKFWPWVNQVR